MAVAVTLGKVTKVTELQALPADSPASSGHYRRKTEISQRNRYNGRGPMADNPTAPPAPVSPPQSPPTDFHIGDEFSGARRNLPPLGIVLICVFVVAAILGGYAYFTRPKPQGVGSIDAVNAADVSGQNRTMVAITVTLANASGRSLWIRSVKSRMTAADDKTYDDDAASAVDFARYFDAFPALKDGAQTPLAPETRLRPGTQQKGTIIVSFPITQDAFDKRKSISVTIQPYDQPLPVVLSK